MDDDDDIHERIEQLEATVADQQQTIEQLTETPAVGRRSVVASLLGAGAVGGLAGYGSQSARAQASGPAGQVGTGEEPVDVEAWNLTVQNEADGVGGVENPLTETLEADGNDVTGVGALETDELDTGRDWVTVTESRSAGTTETNNTDSEIIVSIAIQSNADDTEIGLNWIGDIPSHVSREQFILDESNFTTISTHVPPGLDYGLNTFQDTDDYDIFEWNEYRT